MDYQEAAMRFERALELEPANELYKQRLVQALYKFDPLRAQQLLKEGFIQ
jgi:predicted Zn-dependent protease